MLLFQIQHTRNRISLKCANENNLLISGGSDYHGTNKDIPAGMLNITADKLTIVERLQAVSAD